MDWNNVTTEDMVDALRQIDWKARPRPLVEMVRNFTLPRSSKKLKSRLKCNVYYYRANYFLLVVFSYLLSFYRNPGSLAALAVGVVALLCVNDNFAIQTNDKLMRVIRKVYPPLAAKLRALARSVGGRPDKHIYICGVKRKVAVIFLSLSTLVMMYVTSAVGSLLWATLVGFGCVLLHASLRTHNLKAKMVNARQEFRSVWREYSTDYTL